MYNQYNSYYPSLAQSSSYYNNGNAYQQFYQPTMYGTPYNTTYNGGYTSYHPYANQYGYNASPYGSSIYNTPIYGYGNSYYPNYSQGTYL